MENTSNSKNDSLAIVAYITLIGTLVAFFMNREKRNPLVSFHIRQALGLWLLQMVLGYTIGAFDSWMISTSFWVFFIVLFLYGIFGAVSKKMNEIPMLGPFFQKLFASIGQ